MFNIYGNVRVSKRTMKLTAVEFPHHQLAGYVWHINTQPQLNILSGGLVECFSEPWHVGVSTAEILFTITLLPIPQGIIGEETTFGRNQQQHCYQSHSSSHFCQRRDMNHCSGLIFIHNIVLNKLLI